MLYPAELRGPKGLRNLSSVTATATSWVMARQDDTAYASTLATAAAARPRDRGIRTGARVRFSGC